MFRNKVVSTPSCLLVVMQELIGCQTAAREETIKLEAEKGELVGTTVMKAQIGYTGTGYVGGFEAQGTAVRFHNIHARGGIYNVRIRYSAPSEKGVILVVNDKKVDAMLPPLGSAFEVAEIGKVELKAGSNEIGIKRGWGYYKIDSLEFLPAPAPSPLKPIKPSLVDASAIPAAHALMRSCATCLPGTDTKRSPVSRIFPT